MRVVIGVYGKPDDVEGIHHRDRVGELFGGRGLEPVNPSTETSTASRQAPGCSGRAML
jgi:hypothetical protein